MAARLKVAAAVATMAASHKTHAGGHVEESASADEDEDEDGVEQDASWVKTMEEALTELNKVRRVICLLRSPSCLHLQRCACVECSPMIIEMTKALDLYFELLRCRGVRRVGVGLHVAGF